MFGQLAQPIGIGAGHRSHHQHQIDFAGKIAHGVLAVLGGVTDVVPARCGQCGKARHQRLDHGAGVIHRQRGLGDIGHALGITHPERRHIGRRLDQMDLAAMRGIETAQRAFHFRVPCMADQDHIETLASECRDFHVHLGHQRTGSVENLQTAVASFIDHGPAHAMGGKDDGRPVGHFAELIDEHRAAGAQPFDHEAVVHHFMTHIDGRTECIERPFDDIDGPLDAGTEAARIGQNDFHGALPAPAPAPPLRFGFRDATPDRFPSCHEPDTNRMPSASADGHRAPEYPPRSN